MGILDAGLDKRIEKIVQSGKLLCPFTIGSASTGLGGLQGWTSVALERSIPCGAWCKLYDGNRSDCRLVAHQA